MNANRPRLLVFILTYGASRHIRAVVKRIPRDLGDEFDVEFFRERDDETVGGVAMKRFG